MDIYAMAIVSSTKIELISSESAHGAKVTISGDEIPNLESALVISNHLSYSDFYLLHAVAIRKGMLGRCRYFAKDSLKWIPLLGWCLVLMRMIMVTRNWMRDQAELYKVFQPIREYRLPIWLVTYVEGTRFVPFKHKESLKLCKSRGKEPLHHVLYPRQKGFYTMVKEFRHTHIRYVYDFTIVYRDRKGRLQHAPTPVEVHGHANINKYYSFHVHVRRYAIADIPTSEEGTAKWLEARWYEKDEILVAMRKEWNKASILGEVKQLV
jgi:1-acyl-sn-glycerol-3-phosphate acyltransferase